MAFAGSCLAETFSFAGDPVCPTALPAIAANRTHRMEPPMDDLVNLLASVGRTSARSGNQALPSLLS